ncbi:MAG: cytochrome oxidase putative small subunit CydP [Sulfuricaulis sp.]
MRKLRDKPLAREITLVLLVKLFLIFGLWYAFFSHPIDRELTDRRVSAVILSRDETAKPARSASSSPPPLTIFQRER